MNTYRQIANPAYPDQCLHSPYLFFFVPKSSPIFSHTRQEVTSLCIAQTRAGESGG